MCEADFQRVFSMSYSAYSELPKWKREVLKKEYLLF